MMDRICPNTGLPTKKCECGDYNPDNPEARHPDRAVFEDYCAHHRRQGFLRDDHEISEGDTVTLPDGTKVLVEQVDHDDVGTFFVCLEDGQKVWYYTDVLDHHEDNAELDAADLVAAAGATTPFEDARLEQARRRNGRDEMTINLAHSLNRMWAEIIHGQLRDTAWAALWAWQKTLPSQDQWEDA